MKMISRRDFLKASAVVGAAVLSAPGAEHAVRQNLLRKRRLREIFLHFQSPDRTDDMEADAGDGGLHGGSGV